MKLSFQTFCLIFVVTILHLVVITAFAPLTKSASEYFANLDVETILENGREDIAAIQEREEMAEQERMIETPDSLLDETGNADERVAATLLRSENGEQSQDENATQEEVAGSAIAIAEPARGAVTDIRILSERVERPEILQSIDRSRTDETRSPELRGEPVAGQAGDREISGSEAPASAESRVPRLQVREIRPL